MMRTTIILIAVLFGFSNEVLADEDALAVFGALSKASDQATNLVPNYVIAPEAVPTIRILPEDVVQESVRQTRLTTNKFTLLWTYTEAGAKKMLAFWEQHAGQKVRTQVGSFKTPASVAASHDPATYPTWREGWLKRRTDKFFGISEDDAKAIVVGLTRR